MAFSQDRISPEQMDARVQLTPALFLQFTSLFVVLSLMAGVDLAFRGLHRNPGARPVWSHAEGDVARGKAAIQRYGCGACHAIAGIRTAVGRLGPDLQRLNVRLYLAGRLPNTPENLANWIENPPSIDPQTAMPALGATEDEARDMAAYLFAQ